MPSYLLGILANGAICNPDELPGELAPCYYDTPRAAKTAGRAILDRHPNALGFTVAKTFDAGHYRTVATELREI